MHAYTTLHHHSELPLQPATHTMWVCAGGAELLHHGNIQGDIHLNAANKLHKIRTCSMAPNVVAVHPNTCSGGVVPQHGVCVCAYSTCGVCAYMVCVCAYSTCGVCAYMVCVCVCASNISSSKVPLTHACACVRTHIWCVVAGWCFLQEVVQWVLVWAFPGHLL